MGPTTTKGIVACVLVVTYALAGRASDWLRFRGPNGSGISADAVPTPTTWSPTENIRWKTPLPGPGVSSPIVVGNRVIVTCYSGYGTKRGVEESIGDLQRHVVCVDRKSGELLWQKQIRATQPEDEFSGMGVPEHGYASHTPTSDGERIYVFLGKSGVLAFDMEGQQLWHVAVGTDSDPHDWGSASSPILLEKQLIVPAGAESRALISLDGATGKELWRTDAEGLGNVWGTPVVVKVDDSRSDIVMGAPYEIWGFNPATGKLRWYCEAMETDSFNSSVVAGDGMVFAIEGRGGGSIAVKVGGKGDITKENIVWTGRNSNRFGTPLYDAGRIYYVSNGIANCIDALTAHTLFQERLAAVPVGRPAARAGRRGGGGGGGGDYASLVMADGKLYHITIRGDTHVFKASSTFEPLAVNRVTEANETFSATPAISDGELFIRSDKHLYCVAELQ